MSQTYEGRYDGLRHNMTIIDLDPKIKVSTSVLNEEELSDLQKQIQKDKMLKILAILSLPASSVSGKDGGIYNKYLVADPNSKMWLWQNSMIQDACMIDEILTHNLFNCAWKNTISPSDWHVDMPYEDIINEKWRELHLMY